MRILLLSFMLLGLISFAQEKTNFIIILTDDMGYGDVGFTGSPDAITPSIDHLAKSGVWFSQGYSAASVCGPARCGLITGKYQQKFGIFGNGHADKGLPKDQLMISQLLKQQGYSTGMLGKWHMGSNKGNFPNDRGFDYFYGFHYGAHDYYKADKKLNKKKKNTAPIYRNKQIVDYKEGSYLTEELSREACEFISRNKEKPFFLYLAYNGVHSPWQVPQKYLDKINGVDNEFRKTLLAMTLAVDEGIGQIHKTLKNNGLDKNTAIFFIADNGTPKIGNKNPNLGETRMSSTLGLRGYKGDTYEGGIRVPFFVNWPGKVPTGIEYKKTVIAYDIVSTIAAHTKTQSPTGFDGVDLTPYLNDEKKEAPHEAFFWYRDGKPYDFAVRKGDWKLTFNDQEGASKDFLSEAAIKPKLFNLKNDKYEKDDLYGSYPEKTKELQTLFKEWRATHKIKSKKNKTKTTN